MITTSKSEIRKEIREKLNKQSATQRLRKSRLIKQKLFELAEFKRAEYVLFYIATDKEVETRFMITEAKKFGKKIVVPMVLKGEKKRMIASLITDLKTETSLGPYGILQPKKQYKRQVPRERIDLVVVPGLAFDKQGHRLGRGGGYYDKFLATLPALIPRIGLAFDFQVIKSLPFFSHDISVTRVISA